MAMVRIPVEVATDSDFDLPRIPVLPCHWVPAGFSERSDAAFCVVYLPVKAGFVN